MATETLIGTTVGGCEIIEKIGEGGMGAIYRSRQLSLDRPVAFKVLSPKFANDATFVARFEREAKSIAKVNHPNILAVYDVGAAADVHYMIIELIDGHNLSEILDEKKIFPLEEATEIIVQAAQGVLAAHKRNIIHRDIKPDNIMLTNEHIVKVSDFGLAKELESTMTHTDTVMGTPAYMSPEQCDGKVLDERADIYALGGTFYRILTGHLPFEAETAMSMMYKHKYEALVPPHEVVGSVPPVYSQVILKMMEKKRDQRFQTMEEVLKALAMAEEGLAPLEGSKTASYKKPSSARKRLMRSPFSGAEDEGGTGVISAEDLITDADKLIAQGRFSEAVRLYEKAKRAAPNRADIDAKIQEAITNEVDGVRANARLLTAKNKITDALQQYRHLLRLVPDDAEAREAVKKYESDVNAMKQALMQIRTLLANRDYEQAFGIWQGIPETMRDPGLQEAMRRIEAVTIPALKIYKEGLQLEEEGQLQEAFATYKKALAIDDASETVRQQMKNLEKKIRRIDNLLRDARGFESDRNYAKAIEAWETVLTIDTKHSHAKRLIVHSRMLLAEECIKKGKRKEAVTHLERLLAHDPKNAKARRMLEQEQERQSTVALHVSEASRAFSSGKYDTAIRKWGKALDLEPSSSGVRDSIRRAKHSRFKRRTIPAFLLLSLIIAGIAVWIDYREQGFIRAAQGYRTRQEFDKAVAEYHKIGKLTLHPKRIRRLIDKTLAAKFAFLARQVLDREEGKWEEAIVLYRKALEKAPEDQAVQAGLFHCEYRDTYGKARAAEGADWNKARALYQKAKETIDKAKRLDLQRVPPNLKEEIRRLQDEEMQDLQKDIDYIAAVLEGLAAEREEHTQDAIDAYRKADRIRPATAFILEKLRNLGTLQE